MNQENASLIFDCLLDIMPDHVDLAGEEYTQRIIVDVLNDAEIQFKQAQGGYNLDFTSVLGLIFDAVGATASVLQLYHQLQAEKRESALKSQDSFVQIVREEVSSSKNTHIERIAIYIYKRKRNSTK